MTPIQLLRALKARMHVVLTVLILTMLAALVSYQLIPKTYNATATIILNYKGTDPITGYSVPGQSVAGYLPTYMSTQIDIVKSITVSLRVVDLLKLQNNPYFHNTYLENGGKAPIRDWLGGFLLSNLKVTPSKESSVLAITYNSPQPQVAAAVANGFVKIYLAMTAELTAAPAKNASTYFKENLRQLRLELGQAQDKVSQYQQHHGIVNIDNRVDVENTRLNELSSQLALAQAQVTEAISRRDFAKRTAVYSPDVAISPVTQALELELSKAHMQMTEVAERFTSSHPLYVQSRANVRRAETLLAQHRNATAQTVSNNADILERRETALLAALDAQKNKVLDLNLKRAELNLLVKDVDTVRQNYETVSQRLAQTSIQGQSNQADVSILADADMARSSISPRFSLTMGVAGLLGLIMGILAALMSEWLDRRVRCLSELERLTGVPVLTCIDNLAATRPSWKVALGYSSPSFLKT